MHSLCHDLVLVLLLLLPCPGKNVLRKEPMSKEVEEGDSFSFNEAFSSKLYKIKIGTVSAQKEGEVEKQETRHKVRYLLWQQQCLLAAPQAGCLRWLCHTVQCIRAAKPVSCWLFRLKHNAHRTCHRLNA